MFRKIENYELLSNGILLLLILIVLFVCYLKSFDPVMVVSNDKATIVIDHANINSDNLIAEPNNRGGEVAVHKLRVPVILQRPKFPTGCEAISLLMVLRYYGFAASGDKIVDEYLKYWSEEYPVGFRGDPRSEDGGMMWPVALADTANDYLVTVETNRTAKDVSGLNFDTLLGYVDRNIPVIIWVTERFIDDLDYDGVVFEYEGVEYRSHYGSHCVVITGYDNSNETIIINNPQRGEEEIEKNQLWAVYDSCDKKAMIIE